MNKKIIGFVVIVISLVSMGVWEFWGREAISYEEILVLKEPLEAKTIVTKDDFYIKSVELPSREALKPKDAENLIGMETSQYVAEGVELRKEYFSSSEYYVGGDSGKGILALATDWLLSYPQTLERGDTIALYKGNEKVGEGLVMHVRDGSNNEVIFSGRDRNSATGNVLYVEIVSEIGTLIKISTLASGGARFTLINLQ